VKTGDVAREGGLATASEEHRPAETTEYMVALRNFVPMAEHVAKRGVALPPSIAMALERVIRLREAITEYLLQKGLVKAEDVSVRRHAHFVDVLKDVQDILGGAANGADTSTASNAPAPSPRQCLSTVFAALDLHEPSEEFEDAPDDALPGVPAPVYNIAEDEDEAGLAEVAQGAFDALLLDVLLLRKEANNLWAWSSPQDAALRLPSAAVATNTAIDLARQMEEKAAPLLDHFGGVARFLVDHYHTAASAEGLDPDHRVDELDDINIDAYDISRRTMFEAYRLLERFRMDCLEHPDMPPLYHGQPYGWCDPERVGKCPSAREQYHRDAAGFSEIVSEVAILDRKLKWNNV
jgi:hypothetical protein